MQSDLASIEIDTYITTKVAFGASAQTQMLFHEWN